MIGQVVKVKQKKRQGRVVGVVQSVVQGSLEQVLRLLPERQGLSTAYIERLNATFRAGLCSLVRKGRSLARKADTLSGGHVPGGLCLQLLHAPSEPGGKDARHGCGAEPASLERGGVAQL